MSATSSLKKASCPGLECSTTGKTVTTKSDSSILLALSILAVLLFLHIALDFCCFMLAVLMTSWWTWSKVKEKIYVKSAKRLQTLICAGFFNRSSALSKSTVLSVFLFLFVNNWIIRLFCEKWFLFFGSPLAKWFQILSDINAVARIVLASNYMIFVCRSQPRTWLWNASGVMK